MLTILISNEQEACLIQSISDCNRVFESIGEEHADHDDHDYYDDHDEHDDCDDHDDHDDHVQYKCQTVFECIGGAHCEIGWKEITDGLSSNRAVHCLSRVSIDSIYSLHIMFFL